MFMHGLRLCMRQAVSPHLRFWLWALVLNSFTLCHTISAAIVSSPSSTSFPSCLYYLIPLTVLAFLSSGVGLWGSACASVPLLRTDAFRNSCLTFAHCLGLVIHGLVFWKLSGAGTPPSTAACYTSAIQLICCLMPIPFAFQLLPVLLTVVIPLGVYPTELFHPLPILLMVWSVLLTVLSNPKAEPSKPSGDDSATDRTRGAAIYGPKRGMAGGADLMEMYSHCSSQPRRHLASAGSFLSDFDPMMLGAIPSRQSSSLAGMLNSANRLSCNSNPNFDASSTCPSLDSARVGGSGPSPRVSSERNPMSTIHPPALASDVEEPLVRDLSGLQPSPIAVSIVPHQQQPRPSSPVNDVAAAKKNPASRSVTSLYQELQVDYTILKQGLDDQSSEVQHLQNEREQLHELVRVEKEVAATFRAALESSESQLLTLQAEVATKTSRVNELEAQCAFLQDLVDKYVVEHSISEESSLTPLHSQIRFDSTLSESSPIPTLVEPNLNHSPKGGDATLEVVSEGGEDWEIKMCQKLRSANSRYKLLKEAFERTAQADEVKHRQLLVDDLKLVKLEEQNQKLSVDAATAGETGEESAKTKFELDLHDQNQRLKEMKLKYIMLKDSFDQAIKERQFVKDILDKQRQELLEMKRNYGVLKVRFDDEHSPSNQVSSKRLRLSPRLTASPMTPVALEAGNGEGEDPEGKSPNQPLHPEDPSLGSTRARTFAKESESCVKHPVQGKCLELGDSSRQTSVDVIEMCSFLKKHLDDGAFALTRLKEGVFLPMPMDLITEKRTAEASRQPPAQESLRQAFVAFQRLSFCVQDVTVLNELDRRTPSPRNSASYQPVDIRAVAANVLRSVSIMASPTELLLRASSFVPAMAMMRCADAQPWVDIILRNLVDGIVEFGGAELSRIEVYLDWDLAQKRISVAFMPTSKNPNHGIDNHSVHQPLGGLRAALCEKLLAVLEGGLLFSSTSSCGFWIPANEVDNPIAEPGRSEIRVKVSDDDPVRRSATTEMLRFLGVIPLSGDGDNDDEEETLSPSMVMLTYTNGWEEQMQFWKAKLVNVCVLIPSHCAWLLPTEIGASSAPIPSDVLVMHMPLDPNELRKVLFKSEEINSI